MVLLKESVVESDKSPGRHNDGVDTVRGWVGVSRFGRVLDTVLLLRYTNIDDEYAIIMTKTNEVRRGE